MNTYIGMKNGTKEAMKMKLQEIHQDLIIDNKRDLLSRQDYYSRKYRGNRLHDVNVGIWEEGFGKFSVQVFLRNQSGVLKVNYTLNSKFEIEEEIIYEK